MPKLLALRHLASILKPLDLSMGFTLLPAPCSLLPIMKGSTKEEAAHPEETSADGNGTGYEHRGATADNEA